MAARSDGKRNARGSDIEILSFGAKRGLFGERNKKTGREEWKRRGRVFFLAGEGES